MADSREESYRRAEDTSWAADRARHPAGLFSTDNIAADRDGILAESYDEREEYGEQGQPHEEDYYDDPEDEESPINPIQETLCADCPTGWYGWYTYLIYHDDDVVDRDRAEAKLRAEHQEKCGCENIVVHY